MNVIAVNKGSDASTILDFIRFAVAAMVVIFHGGVEFVPGYESVMVFFVLSGFFISSSVLKSISENCWSWKSYLINRLTRLWVVLLPALVLSFFWAKARIELLYVNFASMESLDFKTFLANLFFLQEITSPVFAFNGPLWSLSYEFWYYILFPCVVHVFLAKKRTTKLLYLLIVIFLALFLGKQIMMYFPIWLFGALVAYVKPASITKKSSKWICLISAAIAASVSINLLFLLFRTNHPLDNFAQLAIDYVVGLSFALFMFVVVSIFNNGIKANKLSHWASYLAGFSYTLYLTHYPILHFIIDFQDYVQNGFLTMLFKPLALVIIFIYAWLISRLTEAHTSTARKFFTNLTRNKIVVEKSA